MLKSVFFIVNIFLSLNLFAQKVMETINVKEAFRIESFLASDELKGRKTGTVEIDKAADFIADEFKKVGLKTYEGLQNYKQSFSFIKAKQTSAKAIINEENIEEKNIIILSADSNITLNEKSNFEKLIITKDDNLLLKTEEIITQNKNQIVFVDRFFLNDFKKLKRFKKDGIKKNYSIIFLLTNTNPEKYDIRITQKITETIYTNVIGVLPGKSKKEEYVVFSGHYDHLGVTKPNAKGDSIYNGANDDAAGITAVIMLSNYFLKLNSNERTLIFVAFTAEEIGGFGSRYFSTHINADKVAAMFNIEMIGTESKWGKNSAYITGFEKSNFGEILQKNLNGSTFHFEPDPYPSENLFYRSDNATLAALGVPAHTISTSKMDNEPNYHKLSDEVSTLEIDNMTEIIKAIAISSITIIAGKDTPKRVEKNK